MRAAWIERDECRRGAGQRSVNSRNVRRGLAAHADILVAIDFGGKVGVVIAIIFCVVAASSRWQDSMAAAVGGAEVGNALLEISCVVDTSLKDSELVHLLATAGRNHGFQDREFLIHLGATTALDNTVCCFACHLLPCPAAC